MITISSVAAILVLLFVCRKVIKYAGKKGPDLLLKTVVTADSAITTGYNMVLSETAELTRAQAAKLGMDPKTATPDAIFEQLTGVKLGQFGAEEQQNS